jgi:hypothetical protein
MCLTGQSLGPKASWLGLMTRYPRKQSAERKPWAKVTAGLVFERSGVNGRDKPGHDGTRIFCR